MKLVIGFANLGRTDSTKPIKDALSKIHGLMDNHDCPKVLCLNEIDEGDTTDPDDHSLVKKEFGDKWQKPSPAWGGREPIILRKATVTDTKKYKGCNGLAGQTPNRDLYEVWLEGKECPPVVIMGAHYPAGAYHGDRPPDVKEQLRDLYDQLKAVHKERLKKHYDDGRCVLWAMDTNWYEMPKLHDKEKTLMHHKPDWIRALPAPGWRVEEVNSGRTDLPIEANHDYLWVSVTVEPKP